MTTIYVVTQGEYSDYGIVGVFSSKEMAEEVAVLENNDSWQDARIEEYELNDPALSRIRIRVDMQKDGTVVSALPVNSGAGFRGYKNEETMIWIARTDDVQRAVKKTNEMRTLLLANNLWRSRESYSFFRGLSEKAKKDEG